MIQRRRLRPKGGEGYPTPSRPVEQNVDTDPLEWGPFTFWTACYLPTENVLTCCLIRNVPAPRAGAGAFGACFRGGGWRS